MKDLGRVSRVEPYNTEGVILDQGNTNFGSLNKYSFEQKRLNHYYDKGDERPLRKNTTLRKNTSSEATLQTYGSIFYPMINEKNLYQIQKKSNLNLGLKKI